MKFNWGKGLAIAIAAFMAFILYFVIKVQVDHSYDNELVVDDYYKQERVFEAKMDKEKNAAALTDKVEILSGTNDVRILFPKGFSPEKIKGKVSLYRPSSRKLDFEIPISISKPYLLIPKSEMAGGRWDITVDWEYNGKGYISSQTVRL